MSDRHVARTIGFRRYTCAYVLAVLALAVAQYAIQAYFAYRLPAGMSTWLPVMVAAMDAGQHFARRHDAALPGRDAWSLAVRATLIVLAVNLLILAVLLASTDALAPLARLSPPLIVAVAAFLMLVIFLTNRIFLTLGARNELKARARRAGRGG